MKLNKALTNVLIFFVLCFLLLDIGVSTKIRKLKTRRGEIAEWFKGAAQGFLSGVANVPGSEINECLPSSMKSDELAQDVKEESSDSVSSTNTVLGWILEKLKFALDMICGIVDAIKSLFKWLFGGRRRHLRRHRRVFLTRKSRDLLEYFKKAWTWIKEKFSTFGDWVLRQYENLKDWVSEKWEDLKTWTADLWNAFWEKLKEAFSGVTKLIEKVKVWVAEKIMPIINIIVKCWKIFIKIFNVFRAIINAIIHVLAGNALKIFEMIMNLICSYQTMIDVS